MLTTKSPDALREPFLVLASEPSTLAEKPPGSGRLKRKRIVPPSEPDP
jgi:hypothetical protein